jgi:hypothetical protein
LLGVLTASLATYALERPDHRGGGYVVVLLAVIVTAIPGTFMFRKWRGGTRPRVGGPDARSADRAEDHLPSLVVFGHGLLALTFVLLVAGLVLLD